MSNSHRKPLVPFLLSVAAIALGNRVFNHVNPWIGLAIIALVLIYGLSEINKVINNLKNEENENEENEKD